MDSRRVFAAFALLAISLPAVAALPAAKEFDKNGDGFLDDKEQMAFARSRNEQFAALDTDRDGEISGPELEAFRQQVQDNFAEPTLVDLRDNVTDGKGVAIARADEIGGTPPPKPAKWPVLVRRTNEVMSVIAATQKARDKEREKDSGLFVGFEDNQQKKSKSLSLRGAVLFPWILKAENGTPSTTYDTTALVSSLTFDRVRIDTTDPEIKKGETDSLIPRFGIEHERLTTGLVTNEYYRANLAYATDFDLRSDVPTVELQWEPVIPTFSIGAPGRIGSNLLEYRFRSLLHVEAGRIADAGGNAKLQAAKDLSDSFVRAGGVLVLELWAPALPRLGFKGKWHHLWGLDGLPDTFDYWDLGLSYALDAEKRTSFEVTFREGLTPLKLDPVQSVSVGITVKY